MKDETVILSFIKAAIGFKKKIQNIRLLENINLDVKQGELIGLIGRNGAGKSTLLRSLVRLQELLEGEILLGGQDILSIHPADYARQIAYVASGIEFSDTMTVKELVSLGRFPYTNWIGSLTSNDISLIEEAMIRVGINHLESCRLSEISDGERQKSMIARTLAQDTPVIVLDEPTAFLDLPSKYDIISLLSDLTRKGKTVIYSTHDLNIALRFSDKIWLIDHKIIHDGSPEDLILDKTIARIFDSDKIHLNEMTGDFELRKHFSKKISVYCESSDIFHWTSQALQRAGYEIFSGNIEDSQLRIEKTGDKIIWKIQRFNQNLICESIYDLLSKLNIQEH